MVQLQAYGHIKRGKGDQKKGFYYEITSPEEYQELKAAIDQILDQITEQFNSSEAVPKQSEPLKPKRNREIAK